MLHRAKAASIAAFAAGLSLLAPACTPGPMAPAPSSGSPPGEGAVVAAGIGVAAVIVLVPTIILVEKHQHHTVKGCLISGPNGLEIQETQDSKNVYTLVGAPANLKVGDLVRLHGDQGPKVKKGEVRTFRVTEIKKNFGACPANSH